MNYLMRVEAMNFDAFILDTDDLSTIRGGGLLLLDNFPAPGDGFVEIYKAASTAVYSFSAADGYAADQECQKYRAKIADSPGLKYATVAVNCAPYSADTEIPEKLREAQAANRWEQLMMPSVVLPQPGQDGVCRFDRLRPVTTREFRKGAAWTPDFKKVGVSEATRIRRDYGIDQKHHSLAQRFRPAQDTLFTNDLDELSDYPKAGKLHHKIALLYLDGNGFGKILRDCASREKLSEWAKLAVDNQKAFVHWLLQVADTGAGLPHHGNWRWSGAAFDNRQNRVKKANRFRLEFLQWGGDEICLVVPAWTGWWVLSKFFERYGQPCGPFPASASFAPNSKEPLNLSHKAGIVFCHHDAPIHRIGKLAEKLSAEARGETNRVAYQVLESFDSIDLGGELWQKRLPQEIGRRHLVIPGKSMGVVHGLILDLKSCVARSRLHEVLYKLCRQCDLAAGVEEGGKALARAARSNPLAHHLFVELALACAGLDKGEPTAQQYAVAWIHLGELWDYITPVEWAEPQA